MRSITVAGFCPDRNASIAATISAGLRPAMRGTRVSTFALAAWQPVHDAAPGGGTAGAALAAVTQANKYAAATAMRRAEAPPTPDPSPPFDARMGGGGPRGRCLLKRKAGAAAVTAPLLLTPSGWWGFSAGTSGCGCRAPRSRGSLP